MTPLTLTPDSAEDIDRWGHSALRWRMLYGRWREDLRKAIQEAVGTQRQKAFRVVDLSGNIFRAAGDAVCTVYDRGGTLHQDGDAVENLDLLAAWNRSGWWSQMPQFQRDVWGLRDGFLRFDVLKEGNVGSLRFRPVAPHLTVARGTFEHPDQPVYFKEARCRTPLAGGDAEWVWDEIDVSGSTPAFRVLDSGGNDVTGDYIDRKGKPELIGKDFPWLEAPGDESSWVMPIVAYHASITNRMFDPYALREVVDGTIVTGILWSFFVHCVKSASWPQRWMRNVKVVSGSVPDDHPGAQSVITDPATVLQLEDHANPHATGQAQGQVGQWGAGAEPDKLEASISAYERRIVGLAGINPADVTRISGDPRSGYALAVTRSAQREAQRRFKPIFQRSDELLVNQVARLWNGRGLTTAPTDHWRIAYKPIPLSPEEEKATREKWRELIELGLADPVEAYMELHPGLTMKQAEQRLAEHAERRRRFAVAGV